jgi:hypothetical protein
MADDDLPITSSMIQAKTATATAQLPFPTNLFPIVDLYLPGIPEISSGDLLSQSPDTSGIH